MHKFCRSVGWLLALSLIATLIGSWPGASQSAPFSLRALWYVSPQPGGYAGATLPDDLRTLQRRLCPTHILLTVPIYQGTKTSEDPRRDPVRTPSDAALQRAIAAIHALGLKTVLLPVLFVDDGTWGGAIAPTNVSQWFARWREVVLYYARFAQTLNVDVLLIAAELVTMQRYTSEWERLIREVRPVFRNRVSYSANWWYDRAGFQTVLNMSQWALLDYIGVTSYFELTNKNDPTVAELRGAWQRDRHGQNILSDLDALRQRYNKPLVFWEFGYQSRDGTNIYPWDYLKATPPDEQEQADAYQAFFEVFSGRSGFLGFGLFAHQVTLPKDAFGYDVLGKLAEPVIAQRHCRR